MKKLVFITLLLFVMNSAMAVIYKCESRSAHNDSLLVLEMKNTKNRVALVEVSWKKLFNRSQDDNYKSSTKTNKKKGFKEIVFMPSADEEYGDSFHLRLSLDAFDTILNDGDTFDAIAYTTNSRGFVYVAAADYECYQ